MLNEKMVKGELVSNQIVLDMIREAMIAKVDTSKGFLIDGYPRQIDQGIEFEQRIAPCKLVLNVDVSDETMTKRLLFRAQSSGRADDNEETIKKRLKTFHDVTSPVINYYSQQNKLRTVNAERPPDEVFNDVVKILDNF